MDPQTPNASPTRSSLASVVVSCALFAAALIPIPAVFIAGLVVTQRFDATALLTAAIATSLCGVAGSVALVSTWLGGRYGYAVHGLLLGMLFRMGVPLVGGIALSQVSPLAENGIFSMILGIYLWALVVETFLALRLVGPVGKVQSGKTTSAAV